MTEARPRRRRPLLPAEWRPLVVLLWIVAAAALVVLSLHFAHVSTGNRVDSAVDSRVRARLASHAHLLSLAARLGSPAVVAGGSAALAVLCALRRWPRGVVFCLAAAPLSGAVTELVLKPTIDRTHIDALTFPSGHTTGAFALALTVVVLLLPTSQTRLVPAIARLVLAAAALAVAGLVAVAVVVLGWHYATDAVGGAATALTVVIAVAALVDTLAWAGRRTRRGGGPPSWTAAARLS